MPIFSCHDLHLSTTLGRRWMTSFCTIVRFFFLNCQQTAKILDDLSSRGLEIANATTQCDFSLNLFLRVFVGTCSTVRLRKLVYYVRHFFSKYSNLVILKLSSKIPMCNLSSSQNLTSNLLTHFTPLISFYAHWKHQKTSGDQWQEMH